MSKPGDQHGRVTATPALSQKVKASAQLGKPGVGSRGNSRRELQRELSGGVLSVHFWKGNPGRCHWAATSFLKLHQIHHHRALKSFLGALNPVVSILEQRAAGVPDLGTSHRFGEQSLIGKTTTWVCLFVCFPFSATQPSSSTVPKTEDQRPQLGGCHLI